MAGSLPQQEIAPAANPQDIYALQAIPALAIQYVQGLGLHAPAPTEFNGELPSKLTNLEGWQLTELLSELSQRHAYIQHQLAIVNMERMTWETQLEGIKARIRAGLRADVITGRKLTGPDKDDIVTNSDEVQKTQYYFMLAEAKHELLKSLANACQLKWDTVSRHITERGQSAYNNRREHNISNIPLQPSNNNYRGPPKQGTHIFKRAGRDG